MFFASWASATACCVTHKLDQVNGNKVKPSQRSRLSQLTLVLLHHYLVWCLHTVVLTAVICARTHPHPPHPHADRSLVVLSVSVKLCAYSSDTCTVVPSVRKQKWCWSSTFYGADAVCEQQEMLVYNQLCGGWRFHTYQLSGIFSNSTKTAALKSPYMSDITVSPMWVCQIQSYTLLCGGGTSSFLFRQVSNLLKQMKLEKWSNS